LGQSDIVALRSPGPRISLAARSIEFFSPAGLLGLVYLTLIYLILRAAPSAADESQYVGGKICAGCHLGQTERWQGSHHDLAMQLATEKTVLGDFGDARFTHSGVETRFFRRGPKFMVRTDGSDGKLADFEVAYTFGVYPLQQYLIGFPDGRYQSLTIAWDSRGRDEGGQRWYSLYPDETIPHDDVLHWTKPSQNWNHTCAECHSTNLRKGYRQETDTFETTWSEIDVSCEACHGPGAMHVAWAGKAEKPEGDPGLTIRYPALEGVLWKTNPGSGKPFRIPPTKDSSEIETCGRCHSRRSRIIEGVPPGHSLLDSHRVATLDQDLYFADGQIREEVYVYGSFLQSPMYAAGVSCSDCHDAHSGALRARGNDLCTRCHTAERFDTPTHHHHEAKSKGALCVECHMPERIYMGVDARRDHGLRIPRPDLSPVLDSPNACTGCHASMTDAWAAKKVAAWYGEGRRREQHWGGAIHAGRNAAVGAAELLGAASTDSQVPAIARATAVSLLPRYAGPESIGIFNEALHDESPIVRTAALTAIDGLQPELLAPLTSGHLDDPVRSVRFEAARILASLPPGTLDPADAARLAKILEVYREAQQADADRAEAHMRLAGLDLRQGKLGQAEAEFKLAIEREPEFIPAYVNLADLYRVRSMEPEAESILREALVRSPGQADVLHALGLVLIRMKRIDEAVVELDRAAAARPESARYQYVLAAALNETGDSARAVLQSANARHPGDADIENFLRALERRAR